MLEALNTVVLSITRVRVKWSGFCKSSERLANWGDHPYTQEGWRERMHKHPRHLSFASLEICTPSAL